MRTGQVLVHRIEPRGGEPRAALPPGIGIALLAAELLLPIEGVKRIAALHACLQHRHPPFTVWPRAVASRDPSGICRLLQALPGTIYDIGFLSARQGAAALRALTPGKVLVAGLPLKGPCRLALASGVAIHPVLSPRPERLLTMLAARRQIERVANVTARSSDAPFNRLNLPPNTVEQSLLQNLKCPSGRGRWQLAQRVRSISDPA